MGHMAIKERAESIQGAFRTAGVLPVYVLPCSRRPRDPIRGSVKRQLALDQRMLELLMVTTPPFRARMAPPSCTNRRHICSSK